MRSVFFYDADQRHSRSHRSPLWWCNVWAPVVVALTVIFIESTSTFSASNTSGWLRPIVQRIVGPIADASWESFHHHVRKTGHFIGYGTVSFTFLRAWLYTLYKRGRNALLSWRLESTVLAIASTAIVASLDEAHQATLPSRTGTPADVLLDTEGACVLCLIIWIICWIRFNPLSAD